MQLFGRVILGLGRRLCFRRLSVLSLVFCRCLYRCPALPNAASFGSINSELAQLKAPTKHAYTLPPSLRQDMHSFPLSHIVLRTEKMSIMTLIRLLFTCSYVVAQPARSISIARFWAKNVIRRRRQVTFATYTTCA